MAIGAETIGHGWARAHPLFVSGGHGGAHGWAQAKHIKHRDVKYSFTEYQKNNEDKSRYIHKYVCCTKQA